MTNWFQQKNEMLILGLCCHLSNSLLKTMSYSQKQQNDNNNNNGYPKYNAWKRTLNCADECYPNLKRNFSHCKLIKMAHNMPWTIQSSMLIHMQIQYNWQSQKQFGWFVQFSVEKPWHFFLDKLNVLPKMCIVEYFHEKNNI